MITRAMFIGSHFWFAPVGDAFTIPGAGVIAQTGANNWPGTADPNWANWALGICESMQIDPKLGPREEILSPTPGAVQAMDVEIPYAIPEVSFTLLQAGNLALQLGLNTEKLFGVTSVVTDFTPNGGGGPGARGILKAQKYDHKNVLLWTFASWVMIELKSPLKGAPKSMTKPEFMATLLYSDNNEGAISTS